MKPSVSTRNFVGGLLGGATGILLSWYFNPLALPLGVLAGVVLGWWYAEITEAIKSAHQWARKQTDGAVHFTDEAIVQLGRICGLPSRFVQGCRTVIAKALVGSIVWALSVPRQLRGYTAAHPMNRAHLTEMCCMFLWIAMGAVVGAWLIEEPSGPRSAGRFFGFIIGLIITMFGVVAVKMNEMDTLSEMRGYYRQWEVLSRYGVIGLFGYIMARNLRYSIGVTVFVSVLICWCFPIGMICLFGLYLTAFLLSLMHGFYQLMHRTGHWLCFGVTLAVTALSWVCFHDRFANETIVWSIALLTGVVSGAMTEAIRRPILAFYTDTKVGQWMLQPLEKQLGDDGDPLEVGTGYFGNAAWLIGFWFTKNRFARGLRTACFGASRG